MRNEIGAVACFKLVDVVAALPKTHTASRELSLRENPSMNAPTIPVTDYVADLNCGTAELEFQIMTIA